MAITCFSGQKLSRSYHCPNILPSLRNLTLDVNNNTNIIVLSVKITSPEKLEQSSDRDCFVPHEAITILTYLATDIKTFPIKITYLIQKKPTTFYQNNMKNVKSGQMDNYSKEHTGAHISVVQYVKKFSFILLKSNNLKDKKTL